MSSSRLLIAAAAAGLLMPAAAAANPPPPAKLAGNLAYGFCPGYLSGERVLAGNADLATLGFAGAVAKGTHDRIGAIEHLRQEMGNSMVEIGGSPTRVCQVHVYGTAAGEALAEFRAGLSDLQLTFEADPANSGSRDGGMTVTTLKAVLDPTTVLRVQFIDATAAATPMAGFQIFGMDQ